MDPSLHYIGYIIIGSLWHKKRRFFLSIFYQAYKAAILKYF